MSSRAVVASVALVEAVQEGSSVDAVDHAWMYVEGAPGADQILRADWLQQRRRQPLGEPGVADLLCALSNDGMGCAEGDSLRFAARWFATHDRSVSRLALTTVARAERSGQELHRSSLRHEFARRLRHDADHRKL